MDKAIKSIRDELEKEETELMEFSLIRQTRLASYRQLRAFCDELDTRFKRQAEVEELLNPTPKALEWKTSPNVENVESTYASIEYNGGASSSYAAPRTDPVRLQAFEDIIAHFEEISKANCKGLAPVMEEEIEEQVEEEAAGEAEGEKFLDKVTRNQQFVPFLNEMTEYLEINASPELGVAEEASQPKVKKTVTFESVLPTRAEDTFSIASAEFPDIVDIEAQYKAYRKRERRDYMLFAFLVIFFVVIIVMAGFAGFGYYVFKTKQNKGF